MYFPRPGPEGAVAGAALQDQSWLGSRSPALNSAALNTLTTVPVAAPGQQQAAAAGCSQLLFYVIVLPELWSQRKLVLSGSLLVLKENFLLVPGSPFLFLSLKNWLAGHLLGKR